MKKYLAGFFIAFFSMTGLCYAPHYTTFDDQYKHPDGPQAEGPGEPQGRPSNEGERFTGRAPEGEKLDRTRLPQEHGQTAPGNARRDRH